MEAKGINGQIELLDDKIRIKRKGFLSFATQGFKGDKDILISSISSIQFKRAGLLTNGYIQFAFMGGREAKGGVLQATQDENTVMFKSGQQKAFDAIKQAIEEKMAAPGKGGNAPSNLDELEKLDSLRKRGVVTEEEFNAKKRQLLGI